MKSIFLAVLASLILFAISPVFGQSVDPAKEAIEKVKKDREADLAKRRAQKDKAAAEKSQNQDSIPGKLLFRGTIEKVTFTSRSATSCTVRIKLDSGQILTTPYSNNFISRKQPVGVNNVIIGMKIAIVNPPPTITLIPGQAAPDTSATQTLFTNCVISPDSKIYCGNDAFDLKQYYPGMK